MINTIRYIEWDFDKGVATEYARQGECNGCGQCCMALIRYRVAGRRMGRKRDNNGQLGLYTNRKGRWLEISEGRRHRMMQMIEITDIGEHVCSALTTDKRCSVHGMKSFKSDVLTLCDVWPMHPDHVAPFDECSYTFVKIAEWEIIADWFISRPIITNKEY